MYIAMLFEKAAVLLERSQEEFENKDFMGYSQTVQKAIKVLTTLIGVLDPNDHETIQSGVNLKANPWDPYFVAVFTSINDITIKGDKKKTDLLVKSLHMVAELWKNVGKTPPTGEIPSLPGQSAALMLSC